MEPYLPKAGDQVRLPYGSCYTTPIHLTVEMVYTVTKDTIQDTWWYGPYKDLPFKLEPQVHVICDDGKERAYKLSRWRIVKKASESPDETSNADPANQR